MPITDSFNPNLFAGQIFAAGRSDTPLLSIIGGRRRMTNSKRFIIGQHYNIGAPSIPSISEEASKTAPEAKVHGREQEYNVTMIFQKAVGETYVSMADQGSLSGVNLAGQHGTPVSELDWETARVAEELANDLEYTLLHAKYHEGTSVTDPYQTRGLIEAIKETTLDVGGDPLNRWHIAKVLKMIKDAGGNPHNTFLYAGDTARWQLTSAAEKNGLTIVDNSRNINGINITQIVTPEGTINIVAGRHMETEESGTALILNPAMLQVVEQHVPGKGCWFYEALAKTGASESGQIFGMAGLDYGSHLFHGKITGISPEFDDGTAGA